MVTMHTEKSRLQNVLLATRFTGFLPLPLKSFLTEKKKKKKKKKNVFFLFFFFFSHIPKFTFLPIHVCLQYKILMGSDDH